MPRCHAASRIRTLRVRTPIDERGGERRNGEPGGGGDYHSIQKRSVGRPRSTNHPAVVVDPDRNAVTVIHRRRHPEDAGVLRCGPLPPHGHPDRASAQVWLGGVVGDGRRDVLPGLRLLYVDLTVGVVDRGADACRDGNRQQRDDDREHCNDAVDAIGRGFQWVAVAWRAGPPRQAHRVGVHLRLPAWIGHRNPLLGAVDDSLDLRADAAYRV